jgi:hypothetical protein
MIYGSGWSRCVGVDHEAMPAANGLAAGSNGGDRAQSRSSVRRSVSSDPGVFFRADSRA